MIYIAVGIVLTPCFTMEYSLQLAVKHIDCIECLDKLNIVFGGMFMGMLWPLTLWLGV